jgi:peptidylprolyl isomerase
VQDGQGRVAQVHVAEVTDETVVLDMNHPLAGEDLTFDIQVVEKV